MHRRDDLPPIPKQMPHFSNYQVAGFAPRVYANQNQTPRLTLAEKFVGAEIKQTPHMVEDQKPGRFEIFDPHSKNELNIPEDINGMVIQGLNIDKMTGIAFNDRAVMDDVLMVKDQMMTAMDEMANGYIGGLHWTDLAVESWNTYLGVATEAYECSQEGMTNAWNNKENQLCEGAGVCEDLNGDGYIGDAPTDDDCDGSTSFIGWLSEKAEELIDALSGEDDDQEEDDNTDPDECFDKPWEHQQHNVFDGQFETHCENSSEFMAADMMVYAQQNVFVAVNNLF